MRRAVAADGKGRVKARVGLHTLACMWGWMLPISDAALHVDGGPEGGWLPRPASPWRIGVDEGSLALALAPGCGTRCDAMRCDAMRCGAVRCLVDVDAVRCAVMAVGAWRTRGEARRGGRQCWQESCAVTDRSSGGRRQCKVGSTRVRSMGGVCADGTKVDSCSSCGDFQWCDSTVEW